MAGESLHHQHSSTSLLQHRRRRRRRVPLVLVSGCPIDLMGVTEKHGLFPNVTATLLRRWEGGE